MDTLMAIAQRRSNRKFRPEPVPPEAIQTIVNAGRMAPSAMNQQPWAFVAVTEKMTLERIGDLTDYGEFIAEAGACIAVFCHANKYYLEDGCAAVTIMLLAATDLGIGSCWVAGDKKAYAPAIAELLGAPDGYHLVAMVALGYVDPHDAVHDPDAMPIRRPLADVLHWHRFNATLSPVVTTSV
ncbi:MAG: nitroreductase family protein [Phycisphaeraceae bacterium]|nr:nitroreductase family protein [Phycisphaeraceae bacterium]